MRWFNIRKRTCSCKAHTHAISYTHTTFTILFTSSPSLPPSLPPSFPPSLPDRYNTLGQLSCVLCSAPVKSELLWTTHLKSSRHKETVLALKSQQASATAAAAVTTTDSVGAGELSTRKRSVDQVSEFWFALSLPPSLMNCPWFFMRFLSNLVTPHWKVLRS